MKKEASPGVTGPFDFLRCRVVIFFILIFVEAGLLNCINCNPVPRGTGNHPHEASGLTSADSRLQLDLAIALNGVLAKIQPTSFFSRTEDKLRRRITKSKALLCDPRQFCRGLFHGSSARVSFTESPIPVQ